MSSIRSIRISAYATLTAGFDAWLTRSVDVAASSESIVPSSRSDVSGLICTLRAVWLKSIASFSHTPVQIEQVLSFRYRQVSSM